MRAEYRPVNISETAGQDQGQDLENQTQQQQLQTHPSSSSSLPPTHFISSDETKIGINGQTIYSAVAIADTIRPPNLSKTQTKEDPTSIKSFSKRLCILLIGLLLSLMTFWESIELFFGGMIFLGMCFLAATTGLLIGTFVGVFRGQWRVLVPGLILQHMVFTTLSFFPYTQTADYSKL